MQLKVTNGCSLHQRHQLCSIHDWVDKLGSAESTAATTAVRREGRSLVPIHPPGSHHCASTVRRRSFNVLFYMVLHTMPVYNISHYRQTYSQTNKVNPFTPLPSNQSHRISTSTFYYSNLKFQQRPQENWTVGTTQSHFSQIHSFTISFPKF